jgi:(2R)-3-sulfolactate dehydrogenase (NADP+)
MHETVPLSEIERLAFAALTRCGTLESNARPVARSVAAAEAQGLASHGLLRLSAYCDHVASGKVDGKAKPVLHERRIGALVVDAATGFAHPAIDLGFPLLVQAARANGVALLCITNSYNCGVVGDHVGRLASEGLVALAFVNAPASIAPWGGAKALFGTNPIAFAAPREGSEPIVLDQSSSVVARGEIMLRAKSGEPIPAGWALDAEGNSTCDASAALKGSLMPAGGYKGAGQAMMIEILAAGLTGANFGFQASSFASNEGGAPRTGQTFLAIDPEAFGEGFAARIGALLAAIKAEPEVRLPGERRLSAHARALKDGVKVASATMADVRRRAGE